MRKYILGIASVLLCLLAADLSSEGTALAEDLPMGQGPEEQVSLLPETTDEEDLFGTKRGVFHPYLTLAGEWTDNLYNLDEERTSNFLTRISPGIWIAVPRKDEIPVTLKTHNSSAGGFQYDFEDYEGTDRYEIYLLGGLDFRMYSEDSDLNETLGTLEGALNYNFPGGLMLRIMDSYQVAQDRFDIGNPDSERTHLFTSNALVGTADWRFTEKLRAVLDVSLFSLMYDEAEYSYLEREDLTFSIAAYFNFSEKTAFFLQYRKPYLEYDSNTVYDNSSDFYYLGMTWDSTEKLSFRAKVGYQEKSYEDESGFSDYSGLAFMLQSLYRFSEKTEFSLDLYNSNEETDILTASDKTVLGLTFGYSQKITEKIDVQCDLGYENADYRQLGGPDREDDRFVFAPRLNFTFTDWLMAGIGYSYDRRESSEDDFDYYSNTVFADINIAL